MGRSVLPHIDQIKVLRVYLVNWVYSLKMEGQTFRYVFKKL